jgi:hypothetical protein
MTGAISLLLVETFVLDDPRNPSMSGIEGLAKRWFCSSCC